MPPSSRRDILFLVLLLLCVVSLLLASIVIALLTFIRVHQQQLFLSIFFFRHRLEHHHVLHLLASLFRVHSGFDIRSHSRHALLRRFTQAFRRRLVRRVIAILLNKFNHDALLIWLLFLRILSILLEHNNVAFFRHLDHVLFRQFHRFNSVLLRRFLRRFVAFLLDPSYSRPSLAL
uniref:Uncharacterized protein n=1 Tax=Globisporangium ultimum (strain ATCC 200006 / CBS 805.95 / DAOM BR144) TaxID=431595 RepID=K3WW05_GLOUD